MDKEALVHLISELRRCHSEMAGVEAKAAHSGTPPDLFKPLSASCDISTDILQSHIYGGSQYPYLLKLGAIY
jgi:hypothetical protein